MWQIADVWEGATVFIIGGGPSLAGCDLTLLRERRVIGCNNAYALGMDIPDIVFFGDHGWFDTKREDGKTHRDVLLGSYRGIIVTCAETPIEECDAVYHLHRVRAAAANKPIALPPRINWYNNTGATALAFATALGACRIVLVGFDMHTRPMTAEESAETERLWKLYGNEQKNRNPETAELRRLRQEWSRTERANWHFNLKSRPRPSQYPLFIEMFSACHAACLRHRPTLEVINATPGSSMTHFPITTLEDALQW